MSDADTLVETTLFTDNYILLEELGTGAFSTVRKCLHKSTSQEYAAKVIDTWRMTARERRRVLREERICRQLHHEHIALLHDSIQEKTKHYFIFEIVRGGELFDHIIERTSFSEADASQSFQQILQAVNYIHKLNIIHRDLKPENLLMSTKGPDAVIKLADFGLALQPPNNEKVWFGFAGTSAYMAPEIINQEPYGKAIDMWSCGVILYILLVGSPPFWHHKVNKLYAKIQSGEFDTSSELWQSLTPGAKEIISDLLTLDQNERISVNEAFEYPWIWRSNIYASSENRRDTISGIREFNMLRLLKDTVLTTVPPPLKPLSQVSGTKVYDELVTDPEDTFSDAMETTPETTVSTDTTSTQQLVTERSFFQRLYDMFCVIL